MSSLVLVFGAVLEGIANDLGQPVLVIDKRSILAGMSLAG